jgi:hypothetical protein
MSGQSPDLSLANRLNAALIPARNAPNGSSYVYRDPVRSRLSSRYRLEVIRFDGSRTGVGEPKGR